MYASFSVQMRLNSTLYTSDLISNISLKFSDCRSITAIKTKRRKERTRKCDMILPKSEKQNAAQYETYARNFFYRRRYYCYYYYCHKCTYTISRMWIPNSILARSSLEVPIFLLLLFICSCIFFIDIFLIRSYAMLIFAHHSLLFKLDSFMFICSFAFLSRSLALHLCTHA